jgi:hypothetical protein
LEKLEIECSELKNQSKQATSEILRKHEQAAASEKLASAFVSSGHSRSCTMVAGGSDGGTRGHDGRSCTQGMLCVNVCQQQCAHGFCGLAVDSEMLAFGAVASGQFNPVAIRSSSDCLRLVLKKAHDSTDIDSSGRDFALRQVCECSIRGCE